MNGNSSWSESSLDVGYLIGVASNEVDIVHCGVVHRVFFAAKLISSSAFTSLMGMIHQANRPYLTPVPGSDPPSTLCTPQAMIKGRFGHNSLRYG